MLRRAVVVVCFLLPTTSGFAGGFRHDNHDESQLRRRVHSLKSNSDDTSASKRIANSQASLGLLLDFGQDVDDADIVKLASLLKDFSYCHSSIKRIFNVPTTSAYPFGPTYLKPLSPGDAFELPMGEDIDPKLASLQCFTALFLLSSCLEIKTFVEAVHCGHETLRLLLRLNLVFVDGGCIVPLVHLFALDIPSGDNLVIVTDLHPNVLRRTSLSETEGAVMYIGPDSISLVHHFEAGIKKFKANGGWPQSGGCNVLDLCTGSGIQALATMAMLRDINSSSVVADVNDRALRFARFNAKLNGFGNRLRTCQVNLLDESDRKRLQAEKYDIVLANPPFIPTPPSRSDRPALLVRKGGDDSGKGCYSSGSDQNRSQMQTYGLFSSGGVDGEDCLRSVIELAPHLLNDGGILAIVSEFMNPSSEDEQNQNCALQKICQWWGSNPGVGMYFSNELPVSAKIYAERRAISNDLEEAALWLTHLKDMNIKEVSPGLLFIIAQKGGENDNKNLLLSHRIVPKSDRGSIWTPHNKNAIEFTSDKLNELFV